MNDIWMWPQADIGQTTVTNDLQAMNEIEQYFGELYAPFKVVYFARARIALTAISAVAGLSRPKLTFVQPFSSHCVLSAIAHLSTPTTTRPERSDAQVIYHQWGHKTTVKPEVFGRPLVEDAVDTLLVTNDREELFPNNAPFSLFSLPKICGSSIGAIVVCQDASDYDRLLEERTNMSTELDNPMQFMNISQFKENILQSTPTLAPVLPNGIKAQFELAADKIRENLANLRKTYPFLDIPPENATRLPANIMVKVTEHSEEQLYPLLPFNVIEKQRTYFDYNTLTCEKVWLLPSHCQANWTI